MKQFIEYLQIRYNLKREYFTIVLPVVVAILVVLAALVMGYGMPGQTAQSKANDRTKAYEELLKQLDEQGVNTTPAGGGASQTPQNKTGLDSVLIFATIIAITPFAIDITLLKIRTRRKEELYTEFLFKLSELMRGGLDPVKAVTELSKTDLGALTPHVHLAATAMTFGKSFEDAMRTMSASLHSELIKRYTELVVQASYSGGSVSDLILKSSEDMRSIIGIEREKEGNLSQYTMIFYFAQGIIVFIAYILTTSLLPFLQGMGANTFFGKNQLMDIDIAGGFFHLLMINAFFGGLIIGKISEGDVKYGLKHVVILMVATYIAASVLIIPAPAPEGAATMKIEVVSGTDQAGMIGLPLKNPVVFRVTDLEGKTLAGTEVQLEMLPEGKLDASKIKSDDLGLVPVKVRLGAEDGPYRITAKAGGAVAIATISTTALK